MYLYWFRTPPGVKVGRAALDDDALRRIEKLNPEITFDWPRILKGQGTPATESRPPFEARRQRPDNRRPTPPQAPAPAAPLQPLEETPASALTETGIEGETPGADSDDVLSAAEVTPEEISAPPAALAKLGAEGIQRLRSRYAEILVRITERTADPERREELKWQADRLNPDSWVTAEDVAQALEQYETVLASLGDAVGQRRRRKRRGSRQRPAESEASSGQIAGTGESTGPAGEPRDAPELASASSDDDQDEEDDEPVGGES